MTTPRVVPGRYPTGDRSWRRPESEDPFGRDWVSAGFRYQSVDISEMMQSGALGILPQMLTSAKRTTPAEDSRGDRIVELVTRIDSLEQDVVALKRELQTSQNLNDELLNAVERLATVLSAARVPRATGNSIVSSALLPSDGAKRRSANRWRLPGFSIPPTCELSGWANKPPPGFWRNWRSVAASGTSLFSRLPGRTLLRRKIVVSGPGCGQPGRSGGGSTGGSIDRFPASV